MMDLQPDDVFVSGKFRLECSEGTPPRVVFLPPRRALLSESQLKTPATFNESVDKVETIVAQGVM